LDSVVQIDVEDSGLGITADDQEKLFTRFFRAESAAVRKQPGTGLGLNITKSLVEMHGGEIWLTSQLNVGTTISFTLPLPEGLTTKTQKNPAVLPPSPEQADRLLEKRGKLAAVSIHENTAHIMIVDDDIQIARLFQHRLQEAGYRVTIQENSQNIIETARDVKPDLITLDLLMEVDGLSILKQLKDSPETNNIPVVVISVVPESKKGLALGAADYLTKPVDRDALLGAVGRIFDQLEQDKMGRKILVVDDDKDIANWLRHALTVYGYEVTTAHDGIECLEAVDKKIPDLILLDMMRPRMDGATTVRKLREKQRSQHIPIVVLSANPPGDEKERAQLFGAGVKEFLKKPVPIENVVSEIEKHLRSTK
jgi:DNA-binding response OmpR family regulator